MTNFTLGLLCYVQTHGKNPADIARGWMRIKISLMVKFLTVMGYVYRRDDSQYPLLTTARGDRYIRNRI